MAQGVDEAMLDIPGRLSTSANPSTNRMCMVYGHRNRIHLRILEKVEHDDAIIATMSDGTIYTYTVTDIQIYENSRSAAVDRRKNHLTCDFLSVPVQRQRAGEIRNDSSFELKYRICKIILTNVPKFCKKKGSLFLLNSKEREQDTRRRSYRTNHLNRTKGFCTVRKVLTSCLPTSNFRLWKYRWLIP